MRNRSILLLAFAIASAFHLSPLPAQSTVTVAGRELRYRGERLVLHGVGMTDPLLARQNRPAADYRVLAKQWKANVVRLAIHPGTWKDVDHDYLVMRLRQEIDAAMANGMFVILTWHVIGWPDSYYEQPGGPGDDFYDSDFQLAQDYWTRMATEFGGNGRVIFELWNEPVHPTDIVGPQVPRWGQLKHYYETLTALVRERSGNLVLATGNDFASDLRGIAADPLADKNTAYTWHVYAFGAINEPALAERLAGVDRIAPLLVTEWGFNFSDPAQWPDDAANFGPAFVKNFLRGRQLHSAAWAWAPGWSPSMIEADWSTPTSYGVFVKKFLAANHDVSVKISGRKTIRTNSNRVVLRGKASAPLGIDRIDVKVGKARYKRARGTAKWTFKVRGVSPGRTKILVRVVDIAGTTSPVTKVAVTRQPSVP